MANANAPDERPTDRHPRCANQILPLVYQELRRLAASRMMLERPGQTLQATALVHEAYLRLVGDGQGRWQNRRHFFAAASEAMRRILVERARQKRAQKRGGGLHRTGLEDLQIAAPLPDEELLALHEALDALTAHDPVKAELVKLRSFVGLTLAEAAAVLGIAEGTAKRDWAYARAWLYRRLEPPA